MLLLAGALITAVVVYRVTFFAMVQKWYEDTSFSHGFLILPISLWLVWTKSDGLAGVAFRSSWAGVLAALLCTIMWMVARGSGVLVIEQLAVVAMIPALVVAALGGRAALVLIFPLAFLFFMVPFGQGIVPLLMQFTADLATLALRWTGIPVLRSQMQISIPAGSFEVARACSGLNYFVTSLVLGSLFAHLTYRAWGKRLLCVAAFIVIPVLLNGLRVYITILVSHLTDMRFGSGYEHITFGRIFFAVMMLVLFWIGRRWSDSEQAEPVSKFGSAPVTGGSWVNWLPLPVACLVLLPGPALVATSIAQAQIRLADTTRLVRLPASADGWDGPGDATGRWRPLYHGGLVERQALYTDAQGGAVDVFVAVYGFGTRLGAEMISFNNIISAEERARLVLDERRRVKLSDDAAIEVREIVISDGEAKRLVWQWFVIGGRPVLSKFTVKALEAVAFVTRAADSERMVTLSTPLDLFARERLQTFATAHVGCVAQGFQGEACGK